MQIDTWAKMTMSGDVAFAERMIVGQGVVAPMVVLHTPEAAIVIPAHFAAEERDEFHDVLRLMILAHEVQAVGWLSEAWMRRVVRRIAETRTEMAQRARAVMPSAAEDRMEIVSVVLNWRRDDETKTLVSIREILRNDTASVVGLGPELNDNENGECSGRMVDILPPGPVPADVRAMARNLLTAHGFDLNTMQRKGTA